MSKVIEDLQWFYKTLDIGGKTAEFYEAQKDIILQALVVLEKQIPKKVIFVHPLQKDDGGDYMCPSCKSGTVYDAYGNKSPYCHYCGQAIKWE